MSTAARMMMAAAGRTVPGGGGFDPLSLSPTAWWDPSDTSTVTESGGVVSQLDDKSGNGWDLTPGTVGPTTGADTINGLNALTFSSGGPTTLTNASFSAMSKPFEVYLVAKNTRVAASQRSVFFLNNDGRIFHTSGGTIDLFQGNFLSTGAQWGTTNAHQITAHFMDDATGFVAHDGNADVTGSTGLIALTGGVRLGGNSNSAEVWDGLIAEVLVFDSPLGSTDRSDLETYLMDKWGIA